MCLRNWALQITEPVVKGIGNGENGLAMLRLHMYDRWLYLYSETHDDDDNAAAAAAAEHMMARMIMTNPTKEVKG